MATMVTNELESEVPETPRRGGSRMGRKFIFSDETYHLSLFRDYFAEKPTYGPVKFRRRFRMRRELFCALWMQLQHLIHGLCKNVIRRGDGDLARCRNAQQQSACLRMDYRRMRGMNIAEWVSPPPLSA